MSQILEVIKRGGMRQSETFNAVKLQTSIQAACLSVRSPEGEAEMVAKAVALTVHDWCHARSAVTAHDIRRVASQFLARLHPEAAYMYETHQTVI